MTFEDEVRQVVATKGQEAAVALVRARVARNEPGALLMAGIWALWGAFGPQDLGRGYSHVLQAAKLGHEDATLLLTSLLMTGTPIPRDELTARKIIEGLAPRSTRARRMLEIVSHAPVVIGARRILRADPLVATIPGLLSAEECAYIIAAAEPRLEPSSVIDPETGRNMQNPVRDSLGTSFAPTDEDLVIHTVNTRIAAATGTDWAQGEMLHILRYTPGQQYRRHVDALPGVKNQRILTALIYLNDGYDGGETAFDAGLQIKGGMGDMVMFANATPEGRVDPRTEHAGLPVDSGVKWLATRWIRARPAHPWRPETLR